MRKKIQETIRGKIESVRHKMIFPEKELRFSVIENDTFQGKFSFEAENHMQIRGIVSCPNSHVTCLNPGFDGRRIRIPFEYRSEGMTEGSEEEGYFVITSNIGEFLYPYHAVIRKNYTHTSIGWIKTLNDFTNLAKLNWPEALALFSSGSFSQIFHKGEERELALYRGLTSRGFSSAQMEEFLTAAGRKEQNYFFLNSGKQTFVTSDRPISDFVPVEKANWGYMQIHVSCDSDFVELSAPVISGTDFTGKHAEFAYRILPERMHDGRNLAQIVFETVDQRETVEITAASEDSFRYRLDSHRRDVTDLQLELQYIGFRLGRIEQQAWKKNSLDILTEYQNSHPEDLWHQLYAAYVQFICKDTAAAEEILVEFDARADWKRTPMEGLYLYLTTFQKGDPEYAAEVTALVRELYQRFPGHPVLAWVLLSMDEALLRNEERRYLFLKRLMTRSSTSPVFYLEAYRLALKDTGLLNVGDRFERRLVHWILGENLLFPDLIPVIILMSEKDTDYHPQMLQNLKQCYQTAPSVDLLKAICTYLISFHRCQESDFAWYALGVRKQIKVAGLYEAFLKCWNPEKTPLPIPVVKYFMMQDKIQWKWKARIYAWLIAHRSDFAAEWDTYDRQICSFAAEALRTGYRSDELFDVFRYYKSRIPRKQWEEEKNDCEETSKITIENDSVTHLCVLEADSRRMITVPVHNGCAFVRLPRQEALLLLQDSYGNLHNLRSYVRITSMFEKEEDAADRFAVSAAAAEAEPQISPVDETAARLEQFADRLSVMDALIVQGKTLGLHVQRYEEQILARSLFCGEFPEHHVLFFRDLCAYPNNERLCDAYVSRISLEYLCGHLPISTEALTYILQSEEKGHHLSDYCKAALVRNWYLPVEEPVLSREKAEALLQELILKGRRFDFYNQLPEEIRGRYLLDGLLYIQFAGSAGAHYEIRYNIRMRSGSQEEDDVYITRSAAMPESLSGIFCAGIPAVPGAMYQYQILCAGEPRTDWLPLHLEAEPDSRSGSRIRRMMGLVSENGLDSPRAEQYETERQLADQYFVQMRNDDEWETIR